MSISSHNTSWTRDGFKILDTEHVSTRMGRICMEEMYSDLTLISNEGTRYPAHRCFLAASSDYFSKLLYGGLKETSETSVNISCSDEILKTVLQFLYSGKVTLESTTLDYLITLLEEVRLMCIDNFQAALEDLIIAEFISKKTRDINAEGGNIKRVVSIINTAVEKDFLEIVKAARGFLEKHIDEIFGSSELLTSLSALGLKELISGNDLDIPEIEIFRGMVEWIKTTRSSVGKSAILSEVRLDQMTPKQLTMEVWPSGLFSDTQIVAAIKKQQEGNHTNSRKVFLNQNICLSSMGAKVLEGLMAVKAEKSASLNVAIDGKTNANDYDARRGYAMCTLGQKLFVQLPSNQKINKIKILLYDRDAAILRRESYSSSSSYVREVQRDYSYKIESSVDFVKWEVVADFSNFKGRSWQTIYFQDRRVKYIAITGTREHLTPNVNYDETPRNYIHCVAIEAMLDTNTDDKDRVNSGMVKV